MLVEGDEPLLDRLHVVVGAPRGLGPLEQALGHRLVRDLEVEDVLAGSDRLLELLALSDLARVAVDEEALGAAQLGNHCLGQQVKHGGLVENNRGSRDSVFLNGAPNIGTLLVYMYTRTCS